MIPRNEHETALRGLLRQFPVVGIVGARQVGKTTLARRLTSDWPTPVHFFDLEDPTHEAALADPKLALESLRGLIVIDEVQRRPELFPLLRVLADRRGHAARFLVLGSASPDLLRQSSKTPDCSMPCWASAPGKRSWDTQSPVPPGKDSPCRKLFA